MRGSKRQSNSALRAPLGPEQRPGNHLTREVNLPGFCPAVEPERRRRRLRPVALGPDAARKKLICGRNPSDPSVGDSRSLPDLYVATNVPTIFLAKSMGKNRIALCKRPNFMQVRLQLHDVSARHQIARKAWDCGPPAQVQICRRGRRSSARRRTLALG